MGVKGTRVNFSIPSRALRQHGPDLGVHLHDELPFGVGVHQDRNSGEPLLQEDERLFGLRTPLKL